MLVKLALAAETLRIWPSQPRVLQIELNDNVSHLLV